MKLREVVIVSLFNINNLLLFILKMEILIEALKDGVAPAIVVAIYLIITKIIDSKRDATQVQLSNKLINSINDISLFINHITENIIITDKDKCKTAIEDSMYASGMRLINFVSSTIINNNIDLNKENILANVHNIVNAEYYSVYSTLSLYVINGEKVSESLNKQWMSDVEEDIIHIIYAKSLDKDAKIMAFTNKINIKFQSYITYILNTIK